MVRLHVIVLVLLLLAGGGFSTVYGQQSDMKDLKEAETRLNGLVDEARRLSGLIKTPEDREQYAGDLSILSAKAELLKQEYPEIVTDEDLCGIYKQYLVALQTIEDNLVRFRKERTMDSLRVEMCRWYPRFDSLLTVGRVLADKKEADSVRMVKSRADDWWQEISVLHRSYTEYFASDATLKEQYQQMEQMRAEIRDLSEQEKMKVRDLLLIGGVIAGVLAMVGGMLGTRIKAKKILKKTQETPAVEL